MEASIVFGERTTIVHYVENVDEKCNQPAQFCRGIMSISNILCAMPNGRSDTVLKYNRYQDANAKFEEELTEGDYRHAETTDALVRMITRRESELLSQVHTSENVRSCTDFSQRPMRFQTRFVVLDCIKYKERENQKITQIAEKTRYVMCICY